MTDERRNPGAGRADREPADGPAPEHASGQPADPESGLPEPVDDLAGGMRTADAAALAARAPTSGASTAAVVLSTVLPGAGHVVIGSAVRGLSYLIAWGVLLAVTWLGRGALVSTPATGSLDDWVALATLLVCLLAVWLGAMRDLRRAAAADARARAAADAADAGGAAGAAAAGGPTGAAAGASQWAIAARHFRRNRLALAGLVIVVVLYLVAFLAPLIAPYDPLAQGNLATTSYLPPGGAHLLGTDQFGRDILSRIIYGARISLAVGFIAVAIAIVLGSLLGAIAGYLGGKVEAVIMRFTDMVMAFPRLVLLIMIIALFKPSLFLIILVLGLTQWPGTARLVRGEVLSLREQEYIQAARALGFGRARIILRHLIPNVLAPVIVAATLGIGNTIVLEAGLSFLGMGVQPPTPSWGTLVADGRQNLIGAWWVATFPGLAVVLTVLAFNLVGDGLRDALDPRLRS